MSPARRPPPDDVDPRRAAEAVARTIGEHCPVESDDLGTTVGASYASLIAQAEREDARRKIPYLFPLHWREFFDDFKREDVDTLRAMLIAERQRVALWAFWRAKWKWAIPIAGAAYAWGTGFFDRWWPTISRILKALAEHPPA